MPHRPNAEPTEEEIRAACAEIQAGWSPAERFSRSDGRDRDALDLMRYEHRHAILSAEDAGPRVYRLGVC